MREIQRCDLTQDGLNDWKMTDVDGGRYALYADVLAVVAEKDRAIERLKNQLDKLTDR
jgi:acetolactate synthase regulatory subunit